MSTATQGGASCVILGALHDARVQQGRGCHTSNAAPACVMAACLAASTSALSTSNHFVPAGAMEMFSAGVAKTRQSPGFDGSDHGGLP